MKTVRVTAASILGAPMTQIRGPVRIAGRITGPGGAAAYLIEHNAETTLATFRFRLKDVKMHALEKPWGKYRTGAFLIRRDDNGADLAERLNGAAGELGLQVNALDKLPDVPSHPLSTPRIALVHTWDSTQDEGWFRLAFEGLKIPYAYISDHVVRDTPDLRDKYDVIVFGPTPGTPRSIIAGLPMRGAPIPWKTSALTPNVAGSPDETGDIRGGLGLEGLIHLKEFVEKGGLFITIAGNAALAIDSGMVEGVSITAARELKARGGVYNATLEDRASPIGYGYGDRLPVYFNQAPIFLVSRNGPFSGFRDSSSDARPSGRGSATDADVPQGRPYVAPPPKPETPPGEEPPLPQEIREEYANLLPGPAEQPRIIFRFADEKTLWVSGMLAGGSELARKPAVVDVPVGKGHVVLFANNPMWRQETQGSFFLLFNAALNYDHLNAGGPRTAAHSVP